MKKRIFSIIFVLAASLMATFAANAQAPTRNGGLIVIYNDIRAGMCSQMDPSVGLVTGATSQSALVYNRSFRGQPNPQFCAPVLDPDGSQMTLGQFNAVTGRAALKCITSGTHAVLHFSGLRPFGVYSAWIVIPPFTPDPQGVGSLGNTALSNNGFVADDTGEGQISDITPAQNLSLFGGVGPCLLDNDLQLHLVYHSDQTTHGPAPGPPPTWVVNGIFAF